MPDCFRVILGQLCNQNMVRVGDAAALIMHDVVITANRCPNQAFGRETRIRDSIGRVPLLAWVRELAAAKRNDGK